MELLSSETNNILDVIIDPKEVLVDLKLEH